MEAMREPRGTARQRKLLEQRPYCVVWPRDVGIAEIA